LIGKPGMIVSDCGTEFTCNAIFTWAERNRMALHRARQTDAEPIL
jgi:hypothetical protein